MQKIDYEYFKMNFPKLEFQSNKVKRYIMGRYLEFNLHDGLQIDVQNLYVKTKDLKKFYSQLLKEYSNFKITTDHIFNMKKIMSRAKEELKNNKYILVKLLFDFLQPFLNNQQQQSTKQSSYRELEEQFNEDQNIEQKSQQRKQSVLSNQSQQQLSQGQQNIRNLYKEIFLRQDSLYKVTFPHLLLYKNYLKTFQIKRVQSDLFQVKFRYSKNVSFKSRFVYFKDRSIYFYEKEEHYLQSQNQFLELFVLVRIDEIEYKHFDEQRTLITLKNYNNWNIFEFIVKRKELTTFLFALCIELIKEQSDFVKNEQLPNPFKIIGNFIISIEQTTETQLPKTCKIFSNFLDISIDKLDKNQMFILPIMNIFDTYEIKIGEEFIFLEGQEIFDFKYSNKNKYFQFTGYKILLQNFNDPLKAYLQPLPVNYHESRYIKGSLKNNYAELKKSTFRLKRFIAAFRNISADLVHFTCFKYQTFTTVVFIFSILINLIWNLEIYFLLIIFFFLFYNHPHINDKIKPHLDQMFFREEDLHQDFIKAQLKTTFQKDREYYTQINNINIRNKDHKYGLKKKISNVFKFSGKVPQHINFFTDFFDKAKNIFMWKNQRKTQMFLFISILVLFAIFLIGKENLFILYILHRFLKGRSYFTKIKQWNEEAIKACLRYFIKNELGHIELQDPFDYFDLNKDDQIEIQQFSKKFSAFVLKYLNIQVQENYWVDKFNLNQILEELLHTEKRLIVPFYEKQRQLPMRLKIFYFLFTTPSDLYYQELNEAQKQSIQKLQAQKQKQNKKNSNVYVAKNSDPKLNQIQLQ